MAQSLDMILGFQVLYDFSFPFWDLKLIDILLLFLVEFDDDYV